MLPSMMSNQAFTRKRLPMIEDHGAMVPDPNGVPTTATFYGSIQPGTGATDPINRNGAEVVKTIWSAPGADVHHLDRITLPDGEFFVNGEPEQWRTGILDHDVIRLSTWVG
ncbi:head-to-tail stopper [Microbacterium phage Armstrong]|uniref:Head-to-tail stopper n=4 Tax=Armstrongvirus armstrong TaxID=2734217 RepID=A0A3G2KD06_9CAUD|nr:head-to-tail stopper [Microbacterium phage Armstrong]AYN56987.1 head-to-tail stopper [Microbacterium phage Bernstein]AYN58934.1 head-to-tail stopper [Microbacterium phage Rollins]QED11431.1 head-to-tail stopper [Microbacterium phage Vitas]UGL61975.1 head-to-tail stopper [Microbacterium phage Skylord]UOK18161.1 head-to-tail stopper [Microbacterium phage Clayda5]